MLENCAELPQLWLGAAKVGLVSALINFNLQGDALAHAVNVSGGKVCFVSVRYREVWNQAQPYFKDKGLYILFFFGLPSSSPPSGRPLGIKKNK